MALNTGTKMLLVVGCFAMALLFLGKATGMRNPFVPVLTEERVKELARPYVEMAVAAKIEAIKPKVNAISEAMIYNDFVSAETLSWELSSYLESEEQ